MALDDIPTNGVCWAGNEMNTVGQLGFWTESINSKIHFERITLGF